MEEDNKKDGTKEEDNKKDGTKEDKDEYIRKLEKAIKDLQTKQINPEPPIKDDDGKEIDIKNMTREQKIRELEKTGQEMSRVMKKRENLEKFKQLLSEHYDVDQTIGIFQEKFKEEKNPLTSLVKDFQNITKKEKEFSEQIKNEN